MENRWTLRSRRSSSSLSHEQGRSAKDFYTQVKTVYVEALPSAGLFDFT